MSSAEVYLGFILSSTVNLQQRRSTGYSLPLFVANVPFNSSNSGIINGAKQIVFKRPLTSAVSGSGATLSNSNSNFIFAIGDQPATLTSIPQHINNFVSSGNPLKSSSALTSQPNLISPTSSSSRQMILAHGVLMAIAWGAFVPIGILYARYMKISKPKTWFKMHKFAMYIMFILTIIAFILSIVSVEANGGTFASSAPTITNSHHLLGLAIVIAMVLQFLLGVYIDKVFDSSRVAVPFHDKFHWYFGRVTTLAAFVNVMVGIYIYQSGYLFLIYLGFIVVLFVVFGFYEKKVGQTHE